MKNITFSEFRDILDTFELTVRRDGNKLIVPMNDRELGEKPVLIIFSLGDEDSAKIQATAMLPGFGSSMSEIEKMRFCNTWNRDKLFPKAYIDSDEDFILEVTLFKDEEVSEEYVKDNFIGLSIVTSVEFFKELKKSL